MTDAIVVGENDMCRRRGQASGMQCGDVCPATDPQLYGWSGILVKLACAGTAPMLGFPLHRGQASGTYAV